MALAALTAGVSWLTGGPAMAKGGALADACRSQSPDAASRDLTSRDVTSGDVTSRDVTGGLATLAPAAGVLSIADAAGAAAGQGRNALPGRPDAASATRAVPGLGGRPAVPAVPGAGAALPAPAGAKAITAPVSGGAVPGSRVPGSTVPGSTVPGSTVPGSAVPGAAKAVPAALPGTDSRGLFPARSAMPLLAVAPAKPSVSNKVCVPQSPEALRTAPAGQERLHPITQAQPKGHQRHPRPEGSQADPARPHSGSAQGLVGRNPEGRTSTGRHPGGQNPGGQNSGAQNSGAQNPGAQNSGTQNPQGSDTQNQGMPGNLKPQGGAHSDSGQSFASGQEQSSTSTTTPRRHRKTHRHPKQQGVAAPGQAAGRAAKHPANQAADQAGHPLAGSQTAAGGQKNAAKRGRQRHDEAVQPAGPQGRRAAPVVQTDAANDRRVPRLQPREYPKAHPQSGDITAPAALRKATDTRTVTELARTTGKQLLP